VVTALPLDYVYANLRIPYRVSSEALGLSCQSAEIPPWQSQHC